MKCLDVDGLTTPEACKALFNLARLVPEDQVIVEIGVFKGKSLLALAEGAPHNLVLGIDPWDLPRPSKPKYSATETFDAAVANTSDWDNITIIKGFGVDVAKRYDTNAHGKVGLWYCDADHRRLPVLADFASWAPHFAPGAVVCFDDHDLRTFPGVVEAVAILVKRGRITAPVMATHRLAVSRFVQ